MERHLEDFIVENWDNLDLGKRYVRCEEEIDDKRKKFKTDSGEIDILPSARMKQSIWL